MPGRLSSAADQVLFHPDSLPPDLVSLVAILPPAAAAVFFFRSEAALVLAAAFAVGLAVQIGARLLGVPLQGSPAVVALLGVGLCGPLTARVWILTIALTAALLEVLRGRFWPSARIHTGLLAYSGAFLASQGMVAAYARPGTSQLFPEPIQQWSRFYGGAAHFIDPVTLYVGNVAGPVLGTSLLAVLIGLAWLWYARRLSLLTAGGFLVGGVAIAAGLRWDPLFQLDSGPAWLCAGYMLADRRLLPADPALRPVIGLAAGVVAVALRTEHMYIEALFLTVAALQTSIAVVELLVRFAERRLKISRERRLSRKAPDAA